MIKNSIVIFCTCFLASCASSDKHSLQNHEGSEPFYLTPDGNPTAPDSDPELKSILDQCTNEIFQNGVSIGGKIFTSWDAAKQHVMILLLRTLPDGGSRKRRKIPEGFNDLQFIQNKVSTCREERV
ncbi:hypothetical protein [Microbulbifer sp. JTAC008]|uniref:hypothetical protein n=1 Tax=unclassified Microbulbifer TaxID=2619833 RepID=UPI0040396555